MITLEEYLKNPCGTLSIPYWKAENMLLPEGMKIVHDSAFNAKELAKFSDERYFRLSHDMKNIEKSELADFAVETAKPSDFSVMADIINASYADIKMSAQAMEKLTETPVYDGNFWVIAAEKKSGRTVGCAMADFDCEAGELVIEWVQVLPEFRRNGIGGLMVNEILLRAKGKADFATVSGKCDSESRPEMLYRACGFRGNDVWHIMRKK